MMVSLGKHIKLVGGGTPSKAIKEYWNGDIPWASVKDFKSEYLSSTQDYISKKGVENSSTRVIPKGTLLIATRMAVGKVVIPSIDVAINQDLKAIYCNSSLDQKFLFYVLKSKADYFDSIATGATVKGIKINHITDLQIPLPPLPQQRKIANILDVAYALRQNGKALIAKYNELTQALFLDMFGDPVSNPKGWEVVTIRDLLIEAKYGTSSKASNVGVYPYLRMNNITYDGYLDLKNLKYINVSNEEKSKYLVKKGDVIFNRTNSKELVGKTGIISRDDEMIIAGYLIRMRTNEDANPYYIWRHLNSDWAKSTLYNMCKSIVGMANINAQELQNIKILKAPIALQNQFAERVAVIEEQKAIAKKSLEKSEELFNSLLQKAFNGKLI